MRILAHQAEFHHKIQQAAFVIRAFDFNMVFASQYRYLLPPVKWAWTRLRKGRLACFGLVGCLMATGFYASAQNLEPRAYANTPVGMNFVLTGYGYSEGNITADASAPVQGAQVQTDTAILGYARSFGLWGKSGKVTMIEGVAWSSGSATYVGQPRSRNVFGLIDPAFQVSYNLYGAPALTMSEFTNYQQNLIIGIGLAVSAPLGRYDSGKLLNIGNNRWSFRPEIGFSKAFGNFTLEAIPAVTIFTDNEDFLGEVRQQDPVYSLQGHVIYSFPKHIWASVSGTYYTGGSSTLDGMDQHDLERSYRVGATLALPLGRQESLKLYASDGVWARSGSDFWLVGIAFQYRWGGGL